MKFNFLRRTKTTTLNYEAAPAFVMTPQLELYMAVATTALSDSFYEKETARIERIRALVAQNDAAFVAKLAVHAREQMNLRSVPVMLAVELAKTHSGDSLVANMLARLVQRADEITEVLACYAQANGRDGVKQLSRLSKQVQKGLAAAFNKFDEYQFAKYDRDAAVKLRDALFLVHPKPKDEVQQGIFDRIARNELATPQTWEVALSRTGQKEFDDHAAKSSAMKAQWEELIHSRKLGYMALLRNLRNILESGVGSGALTMVCDHLSDAKAVARSRQLPFRFLSAYRELKAVQHGRSGDMLTALERAVQHSAASIAGYDETTRVVIAADVSGSMQRPVSARSTVQNFDIGLMLAMLVQHRCKDVLVGMFGDTWKIIPVPRNNILGNVLEFHRREGEVGYSTNGFRVIDDLIRRRYVADKVMMFTDCQMWNNVGTGRTIRDSWMEYRRSVAPAAKLYLFDLAGYGNTPLSVQRDDVHLIAGWSDKVFDVLHAIDNGGSAVQEIERIAI